VRVKSRRWLAKLGALAQLIGWVSAISLVLIMIALALGGHSTVQLEVGGWLGRLTLTLMAFLLISALVAIPALVLCRCEQCAGHVFDPGAPLRKGFVAGGRENLRILTRHGRCPHCSASTS
jgi:hypothetical protein